MTAGVCNRNTDKPDKHAVKEKGDDGFASGAQSKVGRMQKRLLWHKKCSCHNEMAGQKSYMITGIIEERHKRGRAEHDQCDQTTACYRESDHFIIRIACFFHFSGTEQMTDDNGDSIS